MFIWTIEDATGLGLAEIYSAVYFGLILVAYFKTEIQSYRRNKQHQKANAPQARD